jgi:hypothetical protein
MLKLNELAFASQRVSVLGEEVQWMLIADL